MDIDTTLINPKALQYFHINNSLRERDESLDFKGVPASSGIYGIHPYPAMFHFLVVRSLIERYSQIDDLILDPFMGSGVSCGEAIRLGRRFIGYDINPLACLIARVRMRFIPLHTLLNAVERIIDEYPLNRPSQVNVKNLHLWFQSSVIESLARLWTTIASISDSVIKDFFTVVFSDTIRKVSNTRYNEFKLYRRKEPNGNTDVRRVFSDTAIKYAILLNEDGKFTQSKQETFNLQLGNILDGINLPDESVDLVVTSPPYGDSRTTVAYGQFSRLSLQWIGLNEDVDRVSLGSKAKTIKNDLPSSQLYNHLDILSEIDSRRAEEVYGFYYDLYSAIRIIATKVKRGGYVCFVVGNRRVKSIELATDIISADFFQNLGFIHKGTRVRQISNKRMPLENSPTNVPGAKDSTMRFEYIVELEKQ